VWEGTFPLSSFRAAPTNASSAVQQRFADCLQIVREHQTQRTLFGADHRVTENVLRELGNAGYWGLLVQPEFGGSGCSLRNFMAFLTHMASLEPTVAGMLAVHACIGATNHIQAFGTREQQTRWLPQLARGDALAAFALTEPCAGSDLTAIRTQAERAGDELVITGEKFFITNAAPGRIVSLVCRYENQPTMVLLELPQQESEQFRMLDYELHALQHTVNRGFQLRQFRVPMANLLHAPQGNGLTLAYHGLNRGRIALCANAAGTMRILLANLLPWVKFRRTYGEALADRDLIRRRLARLAALIVGADALVAWCSSLLDAGVRGEMECIIAKVFGSRALQEAAIEISLKTHGGRSFLRGHRIGDYLPDYLAPSIYEGEGEILSLAFFRSLVKEHQLAFFDPAKKTSAQARLATYWQWRVGQAWWPKSRPSLAGEFEEHAQFAMRSLQANALEISNLMWKHRAKLVERQSRMAEVSQRIQKQATLLVTSLYAHDSACEITRLAGKILCQDLQNELTGTRPSDRYFQMTNQLGERVAEGAFPLLETRIEDEVVLRYPL
jgi:alkylation response protein AidB-like acyl-CoA dehydrogenase